MVAMILLFAAPSASAATITWTNIAGGNWNVAANWSPNQLPGASDVAEITTAGTYTVTLNTGPTIAGLAVGGASGTQTLSQVASTLAVQGAAQINANGQYDFNGGNYGGTNITQIIGRMNWNGGTLATSAILSIGPGATLFMDGTATKIAFGSITNGGTMIWTNTGIFVPVSVVHNLPGALFEIRNDAGVSSGGGSPVIVNEGTLRKVAGTNITTSQIPIINSGLVEILSGTLYAFAGFTNQNGTVSLKGGELRLRSSRTLDLQGGALAGYGLLAASLLNNGQVRPATNGPLTISGNYTQAATAKVEFELGGLFPGTNHSRLVVSDHARFSGIVGAQLTAGFLPAPGDAFQVMTYASRSGDFLCEHGFLLLGNNRRLETQLNPANLTLTTVAAPDPIRPRVDIHHAQGQILVCWPPEFTGYSLEYATNLVAPIWLPAGGNGLLDVGPNPAVPESYFRLVQPAP